MYRSIDQINLRADYRQIVTDLQADAWSIGRGRYGDRKRIILGCSVGYEN